MTSDLTQLQHELRAQRQVLADLLAALHRAKISGGPLSPDPAGRKNFLALLSGSLDKVQQNRSAWLTLEPAQRQAYPEITELLRESQNLILKILVLDKETEGLRAGKPAESPADPAIPEAAPDASHLLKRLYGHKPGS